MAFSTTIKWNNIQQNDTKQNNILQDNMLNVVVKLVNAECRGATKRYQ